MSPLMRKLRSGGPVTVTSESDWAYGPGGEISVTGRSLNPGEIQSVWTLPDDQRPFKESES